MRAHRRLFIPCLFAAVCAAQEGPLAVAPQSAERVEKQYFLELLDNLRAAIKADDWNEAWRLSIHLNAVIAGKRRISGLNSPEAEVSHLEILAGRDAISRSQYLPRLAKAAFAAHQYEKAATYANQALAAAKKGDFPWTGDAVHQGNVVLGRLALLNGNEKAAASYLIAAGKAPPSPTLGTRGPNMSLARDLLDRGQKEPVIEFLDGCVGFWKNDGGKLAEWMALIRAGIKPNFSAYIDD